MQTWWWLGAFAAVVGIAHPVRAQSGEKRGPAVAPPALAQLSWLAGSWRAEKAGRVTEEQWMKPAGGAMIGMARTILRGREIEHEFLQIREGPGGDLYFIAAPSGQKETAFRLKSFADGAVVFENEGHDFPQTIGYSWQGDGSVLAVVEGKRPGGALRRIEHRYQPVVP